LLHFVTDDFPDRVLDFFTGFNGFMHSPHVPIDWRKTIVNMLPNHGRAKVPAEYRPIASIRLLYKTFAYYMILGRVGFLLSTAQLKQQHGFRSGRRIEKHLVATNLISNKFWTVNMPIWTINVGHAGLTLALTFVKSFFPYSLAVTFASFIPTTSF